MNSFDKIKLLSKKVANSAFKGKKSSDLGEFYALTENDKKQILFNITDENKIEERLQFTNKLNKQKAWEIIKISTKQEPKIKPMYWLYAAASIVALFSLTFFLNKDDGQQIDKTTIVDDNIEIGTDKATLTLEDGSEIILEKGTTYKTPNINSNGENIVYKAEGSHATEIAYNYLTIPRGGQFHIQFSDGTSVWLNSESQLKYPVTFLDGATRKVELIYGEAYFDVSPSTEHKGAKFKVFIQSQEVEVLGTEFNIKAYKDEANIYTTLVEGEVAVRTATSLVLLAPNQQTILNINTNTIEIASVNVYNETSWKKGVFSFEGKTLEEIMKVVGRWYDVNTVFTNKDLKEKQFDGVLEKEKQIIDLLTIFKNAKIINNYEIKANTITLK
ncbi:MAG: FecR family protein [Flavobacteriaceae bacterium]